MHTDVHQLLRRYFEGVQDTIVASLFVIFLVVTVQSLWTLARSAFVELFRALLYYLHEHPVSVPLMLEVAIVSELREIVLNPPTTFGTQSAGKGAAPSGAEWFARGGDLK